MGYLNIHNNTLSGNTFRMYLSDYGKSVLSTGGFFSAIDKFGLSDSDIDYRRFVGDGNCVNQTTLSALTGSCFYDLPDLRGGEPTTLSTTYGTTTSVMVGPRCDIKNGVVRFYDTSLGVNPGNSTLWHTYTPPPKYGQIDNPESGMYSSCWTIGKNVTKYYPSYCITCADFNMDGQIDIVDLKTMLNFVGANNYEGNELMGDFNGDGKVDILDLNSFMECMKFNNIDINNFCSDKEVFCLLCEHLGNNSPCNGDCLKCV
tara:strand:+ start:710 stop:1486 length:777 start_codon:yes stop_codon:yes gene_type:complete